MESTDFNKKLLDSQEKLTLEECVKLVEAVKPSSWTKTGYSYIGTIENLKDIVIAIDKNADEDPLEFSLKVSYYSDPISTYVEDKENQKTLRNLYDRIDKRTQNEGLLEARSYLKSL